MRYKLASDKSHSQFLRVRQKKMEKYSVKAPIEHSFSTDFTKEYKISLKTVNSENFIGLADHEPEFIVLDNRHVSYR